MDASPTLAYGYYIGSRDSGWDIGPSNEYDIFDPKLLDWFDEDEYGNDFIWAAENRLKDVLGDDYGVALVATGYELGSRILGFEPTDEEIKVDGFLMVERLPQMSEVRGWDAKLARALEVLGITPEQDKPGWFLEAACSY